MTPWLACYQPQGQLQPQVPGAQDWSCHWAYSDQEARKNTKFLHWWLNHFYQFSWHSPGPVSMTAQGWAQTSLWAATPNQQLPHWDLLTGNSSEGHCSGTGAGRRNCNKGRAESPSSSDLVCLNVAASFLLSLLQWLGAFSSMSEICLSCLHMSESFTIRKGWEFNGFNVRREKFQNLLPGWKTTMLRSSCWPHCLLSLSLPFWIL